jgi:hypothetical protein
MMFVYSLTYRNIPSLFRFVYEIRKQYPSITHAKSDENLQELLIYSTEEISQEQIDLLNVIDTTSFVEIPIEISPRQIRLALMTTGTSLETIAATLESLDEPMRTFAKIEWEYSPYYVRDNQLVQSVGQALGLTSEELDNLWIYASTL